MTPNRDSQRGLTIVELMVAMVISSIAIAAAFSLGYSIMDGYKEHKRAVRVEQAARGSMGLIADSIRNASAGVPTGEIGDLIGCTGTGSVRVTNSTTGPDELEVIHAIGGVVTSLGTAFTPASTTMTLVDASEFREGDFVIVSDTNQGHILRVTSVTGNDLTVEQNCAAEFPGGSGAGTGSYAPGSLVLRGRFSRFFIQQFGSIPYLMLDPDGSAVAGGLDPEPVAEGVEDLQVAVGIDDNPEDGLLRDDGTTGDEWYYNAAGDVAPGHPPGTMWRALRVTVVARSTQEASDQPRSFLPEVEDRSAAADADPFRRRVLSTTVELRNLEGSP